MPPQWKEFLATWRGASDLMWHLNMGLLVYLIAAVMTKKPLASVMPLLIVAGLAAANEAGDWFMHGSWRLKNTSIDMAVSVFWPFVIWLFHKLGLIRSTVLQNVGIDRNPSFR